MLRHIVCATALAFSASAAIAETTPAAAGKLSAAQCEALWKQALGSDTGDLAMTKAAPYAADFKKVDVNADGKLQSKEWMDGCNTGLIKSAAVQAPASPGGKTSDRTPEGATDRTPGASNTGASGTDAGQTKGGTSDRTPNN
ncbi:MAG: hypothetical protein HOP09_11340 [Hyphomicrobium sp.]|nr:hypothetical protein [Hyphomicrobium sp.]